MSAKYRSAEDKDKSFDGDSFFIELQLTDEIKKAQIVTSFKKDKRTNCLLLALNHIYKQKQIVSPVCKGPKWNQTVKTLVKKLEQSGVSAPHINLIEDVLNNNYEIVSLAEAGQEDQLNNEDENRKRLKKVKIRKYTGNWTLPLHESKKWYHIDRPAWLNAHRH